MAIVIAKRVWNANAVKYFAYLVTANLLVELIMFVTFLLKINNLLIGRLLTFLEFTILLLFYWQQLKEKWQKTILWIGSLFFYSIAIYCLFSESLYQFDGLAVAVQSLVLLIWSGIYFFKLVFSDALLTLFNNPLFWLNTSIMFFFGVNVNLYLFANTFSYETKDTIIGFNNINSINNICYYILLSIGFWKYKRNSV